MLDDFSFEQNIVYKTLINSVKNNKLNHAYLIETNGYPQALNLAIAFAKYLLCPKNYSNKNNCNGCNQCSNIDKNEFIELKIINPEGQWIKKTQLDDLQDEFSKKSILGNKKVYIINDASKLNISSSNSLLKFLEEPEEGIIAILITDNIYQLLDTIVSRCQILSLKNKVTLENLSTLEKIAHYLYNNTEDISNFIIEDKNKSMLDIVINFISYYEENHTNTIIYMNKLWHDHFKEKDEIYNAFTIILLFYKDLLNIKLDKNIEIFNDYKETLNNIAKSNKLESLILKINVIMNLMELIKFNINPNLLMDKLIIELEGCD